jgi:hypothetical protein
MTHTHSSTVDAPACGGEARTRFQLARAQAAANAPTAHYVRVREMYRWAAADDLPSPRTAEPRDAVATDPAADNGGLRVQVFPLDDA